MANVKSTIIAANKFVARQARTKAKREPASSLTKRGLMSVREIEAKTEAQEDFLDAYRQGMMVVGIGSAGTGKSFLSLYLALKDVEAGKKDSVIIVRSTVPTREQGFLKGDLAEKEAPYESPYIDIVNDLCGNGTAYESLKKHQKIKFVTTSFVRGKTFDNSVIIIDEFQSMNQEELYSVLTRVGENTTVIVIGDTRQCDLNLRKEESAFDWFVDLAEKMNDYFDIVEFGPRDIVRSGFVKALILANES